MPTPTPELGLQKAIDSDDTADYLESSLGSSLTTLDSLFNNVSGHSHGGAHQGGPITSIPASAIPAGSITSSMIVDGTIQTVDLADGSVTSAKIADGTIQTADIGSGQITSALLAAQSVGTAAIADNSVTTSKIQDGTIQTGDIAANNVQNRIGYYGATLTFSTTATGTWVATPLTVTVTSAGNLLRIEGTLSLQHSAGAYFQVGLAQDGTLGWNMFVAQAPANNAVPFCLIAYGQPPAGAHTYTVWVYSSAAGTLSINSSAYGFLTVTEQLR